MTVVQEVLVNESFEVLLPSRCPLGQTVDQLRRVEVSLHISLVVDILEQSKKVSNAYIGLLLSEINRVLMQGALD